MDNLPSYKGSGLVNLMAEIEGRLGGSPVMPGLYDSVGSGESSSIVLVLFDGLGVAQLDHPEAGVFRSSLTATLDAPFPTTTSVSLATVATALTPSQHGQIAHLTWMPDLGQVVNSLKWVNLVGEHVGYEYGSVLPRPNLWERLRIAGLEPITVQPGEFRTSPLTRVLYRGARFEGAWDAADLVDATLALAAEPGRFIFTYVPFVDFAGHVYGQGGEEFTEAMKAAAAVWEGLASGLLPDVTLFGTADHGLMEVSEDEKQLVRDPLFDALRFGGDGRGVQLWGDEALMSDLASSVGGELVDPRQLVGPEVSDVSAERLGERVLLAGNGKVVLPRGFDKRLRCYHGGLSEEELKIPLLMG